jgi:hypothetical protein
MTETAYLIVQKMKDIVVPVSQSLINDFDTAITTFERLVVEFEKHSRELPHLRPVLLKMNGLEEVDTRDIVQKICDGVEAGNKKAYEIAGRVEQELQELSEVNRKYVIDRVSRLSARTGRSHHSSSQIASGGQGLL